MSRYCELIGELRNVVKNSPGLPEKDSKIIIESADQMRSMHDIVKDIVYESPEGTLCLINEVAEISSKKKQEDNMRDEDSFTLYTDGACHGNPGPGGWGLL